MSALPDLKTILASVQATARERIEAGSYTRAEFNAYVSRCRELGHGQDDFEVMALDYLYSKGDREPGSGSRPSIPDWEKLQADVQAAVLARIEAGTYTRAEFDAYMKRCRELDSEREDFEEPDEFEEVVLEYFEARGGDDE